VRLRVVLVSIKHHLVKLPVMLLMLATMFLAQPNRARLLVLQEPSAVRQVRARVQTLQQDILCIILVSRVRLRVVLVTIKQAQVNPCVTMLMQDTMLIKRANRVKSLVRLEPIKQTQAKLRVTMPMQVIS
tara:strand:+ start:101 stop:490 length:390 start_codon:yes stop_codon:yes gene_type:complete